MLESRFDYKQDCINFRGHIPCTPHKENNYHCNDCPEYSKREEHILIIKLGAIGDVIRTTTLLHKIKEVHPNAEIWWLTLSPDVVPSMVHKVLPMTLESILTLESCYFDKLINLDKDIEACALTNRINAARKYGYILQNNRPAPANDLAKAKYVTGIFDDANKENKKNYPEEIFEICGWEYNKEEYILDLDESIQWDIKNEGKKIIGLNTGCGARWVSRLWKDDYWIELIKKIQNAGHYPLLLGGKQEHEKNTYFSKETGAEYLGYFTLQEFISEMNQCDVIVSAVTMGMHIAIALKKPLVLMNNIFNKNEFELYGRGEIVEPKKECTCFFSPKCKNKEYFCLDHLEPEDIHSAILRNLPKD